MARSCGQVDVDRLPFGTPGIRPRNTSERLGKLFGASLALGWLSIPVVATADSHPSLLAAVGVYAGLALFIAAYVGLTLMYVPLRYWHAPALVGFMVALSITLSLASDPVWAMLFVFAGVAGALRLRPRDGAACVILCTALAAGTMAAGDADGGQLISLTATTLAVGFMMHSFGRLVRTNIALQEARQELARMAVSEERLRFSRDLHDLLGHSLSVIALKAELAGRLLPDEADEAAEHVQDIETVTRDALGQVREAVSGYRQPALATELEGARAALAAAGIEARIESPPATLPAESDALLAWTVREGTTNVIRHSGAQRCTIRISAGIAEASAEVIDDGEGTRAAPSRGAAGHGLAGLRERAQQLSGHVESGAAPGDRGFRLRVSVPLARFAVPSDDEPARADLAPTGRG